MIKFDDSFNWLAVLKDLAAGMPLDYADHDQLMFRAMNWPTCACGQLCQALPRYSSSKRPTDEETACLGVEFAQYIVERRWKGAITCFHEIEKRTDALLDDMPLHVDYAPTIDTLAEALELHRLVPEPNPGVFNRDLTALTNGPDGHCQEQV